MLLPLSIIVYYIKLLVQIAFSVCATEDIPNGQMSPDTAAIFGATATVNCNTGYRVVGNNPITCNPDRQFSDIPTCELDCTADSWRTLDIEHSTTPANLPVPYLTQVTVKCKETYISSSVVKCDKNGEFTYTGQKPTCHPGKLFYQIPVPVWYCADRLLV